MQGGAPPKCTSALCAIKIILSNCQKLKTIYYWLPGFYAMKYTYFVGACILLPQCYWHGHVSLRTLRSSVCCQSLTIVVINS